MKYLIALFLLSLSSCIVVEGDSLLNYKGGVVLDKSADVTTIGDTIVRKCKVRCYNENRKRYSVYEPRISKYEFDNINIGDTIK